MLTSSRHLVTSRHRLIVPVAPSGSAHDLPGPVVADLRPPAALHEDLCRGLALHVGVLVPTQPPGRSSRAAVDSSTRMASSPSSPDHSASAGSWSRASGATLAQASRGMYGGLQTTTSTGRPARGRRRPCHRAGGRRRCRRDCARPRHERRVQLDGVHLGAGDLVGDAQRDGAGARAQVDHHGAAVPRPARSIAQPASSSVSGRGRKTPGPTCSSSVAERGRAGQVLQGLPAARCCESSSKPACCSASTSSTSESRLRGGPEHVGEQLGCVVLRATRRRRRRAGGGRLAQSRGLGSRRRSLGRGSRAGRLRSASTQEAITASRSPSSTGSRL